MGWGREAVDLLPVLGSAVPCPPMSSLLILGSPVGRSAVCLERGRRKDVHRVQGLLFIYIKTLISATVPPLSKQQLPVQARLFADLCTERPPASLWGLHAPAALAAGAGASGSRSSHRGAENGSQVLLPSSV